MRPNGFNAVDNKEIWEFFVSEHIKSADLLVKEIAKHMWDEAFERGKSLGFDEGKKKNTGCVFDDGHMKGYKEGLKQGRVNAINDAFFDQAEVKEKRKDTLSAEYERGLSEGRKEGFDEGYEAGKNDGRQSRNQAYWNQQL